LSAVSKNHLEEILCGSTLKGFDATSSVFGKTVRMQTTKPKVHVKARQFPPIVKPSDTILRKFRQEPRLTDDRRLLPMINQKSKRELPGLPANPVVRRYRQSFDRKNAVNSDL